MTRPLALLLTACTGFSGLAYEVTWQKYLATLLGTHSEATASVLALFLGGLSAGYAGFALVTRRVVARAEADGRPPRLLGLYGLVELGIGAYALLFPWLFRAAQWLSVRLPELPSGLGFAIDIALSAALIGPPAILMGSTIPVLTQALARSVADATRVHALIYAMNTLGAFLGALGSGFVLIPALGLDGMMIAMAVVNLAAGLAFVALGRRGRQTIDLRDPQDVAAPVAEQGLGLFATVAVLVGFAMMAMQTVLIRLGGLAFGPSEFTFSMVVAVFVLCIALGSFAVSALPRIPGALLPLCLWGLVLLLAVLHTQLGDASYWAHVLRSLFRDEDAAFYPYYAGVLLGLLAAIGPAVLLSGATLPLLFHEVRRELGGLGASAGKLYSWNTVGSLLGALLGGYALLLWLDLQHVSRVAIAAVALAGLLLAIRTPGRGRLPLAALAASAAFGIPLLLGSWPPERLAAGLFRERAPLTHTYRGADPLFEERMQTGSGSRAELRFYEDDPTASIAVREFRADGRINRSIVSNGKSDGNTETDYRTMSLAGLVPALFAPRVERAFVIGFGTGVTAGELAQLRETNEVVVAEISSGVLRAAPWFDFANHGASQHPKIELVRSDAYRALLRSRGRFDVVVSEPSNPWVTGVEMLFSKEFLEAARDRLAPGGVYAQWFHQYETDSASLELVLRTYAAVFEHVSVWSTQPGDILLLGFEDDALALDVQRLQSRAGRSDFAAGLLRGDVSGFPALLALEILPLGVVHAAGLEGPIHTLTHPRLAHRAGRAFFRGGAAELPFTGHGQAARVGARHSLFGRHLRQLAGALSDADWTQVVRNSCYLDLERCAPLVAAWQMRQDGSEDVKTELARLIEQVGGAPARYLSPQELAVQRELLGGEPLEQGRPVGPGLARRATQLFRRAYHHAAPFAAQRLLGIWGRCRDPGQPERPCEAGQREARALLAGRAPEPHGAPGPAHR